jgi:HPt (histidine-containing phosphotransfer) domain-containing protein
MHDLSIDFAVTPAPTAEVPDAHDAHDVLDAAALARLRELDPDGRHDVLRRVMSTFEVSLEDMQVQLRDRMAAADVVGAGALAHTLKSSSASVGALVLSERCARLERAVRVGQVEGLEALAADVLEESARVAGAVRAMLST